MSNNKISIGFSPCPNDTFIFYALVNKKIDTDGYDFDIHLCDVEELNKKAFSNDLDITKLSYYSYAQVANNYILLDSGSALGKGCGPLLISTKGNTSLDLSTCKVAIPGKNTTANFLLSIAYSEIKNKVEVLFSDIEEAILKNEVDAGVIIHENRFTYQQKGLDKIKDLGAHWEDLTHLPIPLGGIAISRKFDKDNQKKLSTLIRKSIEYAYENEEEVLNYVRQYAQEMDENVMKQHIQLYVNDYSLDLGEIGKKAIETMYEIAEQNKLIKKVEVPIFI